jgi:hypothetical protein
MLPVSGAEQLKTSDDHGHAPHDLGERRIVAVRQAEVAAARLRPLAPGGRRQEQVPQALRARLRLQRLDRLQRRPALAGLGVGLDLVLVALLGRIDVLVHEAQQLRLEFLRAR